MGLTYYQVSDSHSLMRSKKGLAGLLKRMGLILGIVFLLGLVSALILYPQTITTITLAKQSYNQAKKVQDSLEKQNVLDLREQAQVLKNDIAQTKESLKFYSFLRFVPILHGYYSDANRLLNAGNYSSEAILIATEAIVPFADSLGLTKSSSSVTTQEKVSRLVQIMPKILPKVDILEEKLALITQEIEPIDPKRYPKELAGVKIRSSLFEMQSYVEGLRRITPELKPILATLPGALGNPIPKNYIILLQNNAELRSTGGFITSVAYLKLAKGQILDIKSEDVYKLDQRVVDHPAAPPHVKKYLKVDKLFLRDANLSPDFVESMKSFQKLYDTVVDRGEYDGFIALDTEFVRKILQVIGPIKTTRYKETFSSEISNNGISDVVYKLELYSQKLLRGAEDRKELLGDLLNAMVSTTLNASSDKWRPLLEATTQAAQEKNILFYSFDKKTQDLLEKHNIAGRIKDSKGDYLHLNQNNYGGLKSNLFIQEVIEQDIQVSEKGEVTKTLKIHLSNPKAADGWLNGRNHDYIRVLAPYGSSIIEQSSDEKEKKRAEFETTSELEKTFFSTFAILDPASSLTVELTYKLPFRIYKGDQYSMLIQKQPGTKDQRIIIRVNGREVENFKLATDRELKFEI